MASRSLSPPRAPRLCRLGILGTRNDISSTNDVAELMSIITADIGVPQELYIPQEGESSIHIDTWAFRKGIPVEALEANWRQFGRRAKAMRDSAIMRQATHFLIFGGPRSTKPAETARALARKGHMVYFLPHGSWELEELTVTPEVVHDHKPGKGKESLLQTTLEQTGLVPHC